MRWPVAAVFLLVASFPLLAQEPLPARVLTPPFLALPGTEPMSFDLLDFRNEWRLAPTVKSDPSHSIFGIKHHVGVAAGWDNNVLHGSVGMYITMVEWGRWNFGAPTVELGLGRYPVFNQRTGREETSSQMTMFVSLASVHYRLGYISSFGYHCYLNLEQIIDMHSNLTGSQFGLTFSRK